MHMIKKYLGSNPPRFLNHIDIQSCEVYEVSAEATTQGLKKIQSPKDPKDNVKYIFIHFGVNESETELRLEQCSYNEADFRIPDQRGYQPIQQPIYPDMPLGEPLNSNMDVDRLLTYLQNRKHKVVKSYEPGRFVCNYIYTKSLYFTQSTVNQHSLFVHVPLFENISEKDQLHFVVDLLDAVVVSFVPSKDDQDSLSETN